MPGRLQPIERREVMASVRDLINRHLPAGYEETMASGMISWVIPLSRYPVTYNKQPLAYVALAAQKRFYSLSLMAIDLDTPQEAAYLKELAHGLRLADNVRDQLHQKYGAPPLK